MVKVPLRQKLCIVLPNTGHGFIGMTIAAGMLKYYTDYVGISPILFGIAYFFMTIWQAFNEPFFGYHLTKMRPKPGKGKFKKIMLGTAPIIFLAFLIIVTMSPSWSQITLFIVLIAGLFLYSTSKILFFASLNGLNANVTDDLDERAKINTLNTYFNQIPGAILGMVPLVFLSGEYSYEFILIGLLILGVIGAITMLTASYFIKERNEWYEDIPEPMSPIMAVKECVKAKGWLIFIAFSMCNSIPLAMFGVSLVYYLGDVFGVWGFWAILPGAIGGGLQMIAMYPLILKIRNKIGTYQTMIIFQIIHFIGFMGFFLAKNYWTMVFFYFLVLTAFSGTGLASMLAITDIVDADMIRTGERRAPMFGGINGLFLFPIFGIATLLFTIILETTGYNATPGASQTQEALFGIRFAMGAIPMIFIGISIVIWCFYPFHGESYKEMRAIIEEKFKDTLESNREDAQESSEKNL